MLERLLSYDPAILIIGAVVILICIMLLVRQFLETEPKKTIEPDTKPYLPPAKRKQPDEIQKPDSIKRARKGIARRGIAS